jgi:hypothetical protein
MNRISVNDSNQLLVLTENRKLITLSLTYGMSFFSMSHHRAHTQTPTELINQPIDSFNH